MEALKSGGQATTAANTENEEVCVGNLVSGSPPSENVNSMTASCATLQVVSALGGDQVQMDNVDGNGAIGAQDIPSDGAESTNHQEDPISPEKEATAKQDPELDALETSEKPEEELIPNEQDEDDEDSTGDSEIFEDPITDSAQESVRPRRYELSYWYHHLASAEKLWAVEEREKSDEWKELWNLVIQFLCESPDAFKTWQRHYMDLDGMYIAVNTVLTPLQVAAAYGIPGLVKILLDRGESAAAETEDGRSALWFGANSPNIEIIRLLLQNGASPNAQKEFEPPFHVLLASNPTLEFVNLMLEHGADCKMTDTYGSTAMHCFAAYGSDVEVFKVLWRAHSDMNVPDSFGETPLHCLMYNNKGLPLDLLYAFLENGADVNRDDNDSQSKSS